MQWCRRAGFALAGTALAVAVAAAGFATLLPHPKRPAPPGGTTAGPPRVVLWAWERPEILDFIDPREVGMAFLARTLHLRGRDLVVRPRLQPLSVPPGTALTAVIRIESDRSEAPAFSPGQRQKTIAAVIPVAGLPNIPSIQIDFEARASERPFLRDLLADLRRHLPAAMPLSMTALASWCLHDDWLAGLPVDEAVPMLFRMGPEGPDVLRHLAAGRDFRPALCRHSLGVSTDETMPRIPLGRRAYVFHPKPWSLSAMEQSLKGVRQWPSGLERFLSSF